MTQSRKPDVAKLIAANEIQKNITVSAFKVKAKQVEWQVNICTMQWNAQMNKIVLFQKMQIKVHY